jgi:hypothetical protein
MLVTAFLLDQAQNLYPGNMPCSVIFKPPPLLVMFKAQLVFLILDIKPLLQHRLNVNWLSSRRTHLKSRLSDLLDFRASAIFDYDSSRVSMPFWKWLEPSVDDIDSHCHHPFFALFDCTNRFLQQGFHCLENGLHCLS